MRTHTAKLLTSVLASHIGLLLLNACATCSGQNLTNSFPTNVFLTDENRLFSYRKGERLIDVRRVKEASHLPECRPANQDPEGHWGPSLNGLQLSLRLTNYTYASGKPVLATVFIRNVSDKPVEYLRQTTGGTPSPVFVSVRRGGEELPLKTHPVVAWTSATPIILLPQTQHRYLVELDKFYDLSASGSYVLQACYGPTSPPTASGPRPATESSQHRVESQAVSITITNQVPQTNSAHQPPR